MRSIFILILIGALSVACSSSTTETTSYKFKVDKIYAKEGRKQWDLFDDKPELYFVIKSKFNSFKSEPRGSGAWEVNYESAENSEFILWDHGEAEFEIMIYDRDNGDNDDDYSSSTFLGFRAFSLVNDADDLVFKQKHFITTDSGTIKLNNEYGGIELDFEKF
jgi:hypothetical protein